MNKIRVAIIGQGRSGRGIHGRYFLSEANEHYQVVAVVEYDEARRALALEEYPGCRVYKDYQELYGQTDIDLVINTTFSQMHYPVTRELLEHGFNVLVEKPMARNFFEASTLLGAARANNALLAVFQQSLFAPHFLNVKKIIASGKLGQIKEVKFRNNGLARRSDWQSMQEYLGGSVYNTGPHPLGMALDLLDFSDDTRVVYSQLDTIFTAGDAADFAKIILKAPGKPVIDLELVSNDAYSPYLIKVLGTRGCLETTAKTYKMKYAAEDTAELVFCEEEGATKEEGVSYGANAFYDMIYEALVNGAEPTIKAENIAKLVNIIERIHADNPLPVKYVNGKQI